MPFCLDVLRGPFACDRGGPVDACFVAVNRPTLEGIGRAEALVLMTDVFKLGDAYVGGNNLSFTGADRGEFPGDGAASVTYDKSKNRAKLKKFKRSVLWNCFAKLSTAARISKHSNA